MLLRLPASLLALAMAAGAAASGIDAPIHIQNEIPNARLSGQDYFRWFGLEIYAAELWVGDPGFRTGAAVTAKYALELRYQRNLQGSRIAESSRDEIQKLGFGTASQLQSWLAQMSRLFPDVRKGTRITGVHLPNAGVRFYVDGKPLGELLDPEFGRAFFAIWLDPKTSVPALRDALLLNAAPRQ